MRQRFGSSRLGLFVLLAEQSDASFFATVTSRGTIGTGGACSRVPVRTGSETYGIFRRRRNVIRGPWAMIFRLPPAFGPEVDDQSRVDHVQVVLVTNTDSMIAQRFSTSATLDSGESAGPWSAERYTGAAASAWPLDASLPCAQPERVVAIVRG